jgi:TonB-linked SusC/RagA family outer membrane protein
MKKLWMLFGFPRGSLSKLVLKMKLLTFLMFAVLAVSAADSYSQAAKFSIKLKDATVREVFDHIEENSEFILLYNEKWVDINRRVDINVKNETVEKVLDQTFKGTRNVYKSYDRQIVILQDEKAEIPANVQRQIVETQIEQPQEKEITGKVTDTDGLPLPGVSVIVKGTTIGTITNNDGEFSLNIPLNAEILQFSFVGMKTQEKPIEGRTTFSVVMEEDILGLEEVVAVGYGTQRKATLTGSIAAIGDKEILRSPANTVGTTIQGLLPGLISLQRTGDPGNDLSTILVRGQSTTGSNSPLVLVDGVPEPDWQRINANDIESVSTLKDASAAIYGVQAANGVILITTKRGSESKPTFNFTYNQGIIQPARIPKMASSATQAEFANEYLERTGGDPMYTDEEIQKFRDGSDPIFYPNTNWPEECLKDFSFQNSANLNVRGGTENVRYSLSGSYRHQDDVFKNGIHEFKNYTIRSNIDAIVNENLTLSLDINAGMGDRMAPQYRTIQEVFINPPTVPVYWPGGYPRIHPQTRANIP